MDSHDSPISSHETHFSAMHSSSHASYFDAGEANGAVLKVTQFINSVGVGEETEDDSDACNQFK